MKEGGKRSLVQAAKDVAAALGFKPSEREAVGLERIEGLAAWLGECGLKSRVKDVDAWCTETGKASGSSEGSTQISSTTSCLLYTVSCGVSAHPSSSTMPRTAAI